MLIAEIRGKKLPEARKNEDYLTSTVFGHVRYIPPHVFWPLLFSKAPGIPDCNGVEQSLADAIRNCAEDVSCFTQMDINFWPRHPDHGEHDLVIVFRRATGVPLVIAIETKLWAGKSGSDDQLARYVRALGDLKPLGISVPADAPRFLVYLTRREALDEIKESAKALEDQAKASCLFRLRWQNVAEAAEMSAKSQPPAPWKLILSDVAEFLRRLGLTPFGGFDRVDLPQLAAGEGTFLRMVICPTRGDRGFFGFGRIPELERFAIEPARWAGRPLEFDRFRRSHDLIDIEPKQARWMR